MAGIYLHIPFCKQACSYCNFHFSTLLKSQDAVLQAMLKELENRQDFFSGETKIESIYFGGGTPSILPPSEIQKLIEKIHQLFTVSSNAEITLEANPDDLSREYLSTLKKDTPINRFSIGIQSFLDADLQYMHRAHHAEQAKNCIKTAQDVGFQNLSIDLIYGTPTMNNEQWQHNVQTAFDLQIPHLSCYALTVEVKTALANHIQKKKTIAPDEEQMVQQFSILMQAMRQQNYVHYEISNFAKESHFAVHNSNYWKGIPYLGIGAAAHSYDGKNRYWNIANNTIYVQKIKENKIAYETETLTNDNRYNEYVMTRIRTIFGVDAQTIKQDFGELYYAHFMLEISPFISNKWVVEDNGNYTLTDAGKIFCDYITENLFADDLS